MRKCVCIGAALVLSAAVAACGSSKSQTGGVASNSAGSSKSYPELKWGIVPFAGPIDYQKNPTMNQAIAAEQLAVQNLMEFEPSGRVKPGVAESVTQPNPTTYVYHLRPIRFSDGKPLTAADVAFSLERNVLQGGWTKPFFEDMASVSARGDSTVVVKLKQPNAFWQDVLAFTGQIVEKAQAERVGEKALGTPGHLPIGTGPWKLDSYQPEASIELSRNPYWTGAPQPAQKIDVGIFKSETSIGLALRSGAIDGAFYYVAPKIFESIPGTRQLTAPGTSVSFVGVNVHNPPFNDLHVRRALAYATDVKGIIDAVYPKRTATEDATLMPTSLFSSLGSSSEVEAMLKTLPKYEFDLAAAKRELAKSPYPHGFTTKVEVGSQESNNVLTSEIIAADLAKIGITAKVDEVPPAEYSSLFGSKVQILVNEYVPPYADPEGMLSLILPASQIGTTGWGLNYAAYRNAEVAKLQAEESETLNSARRLQLIGKMLRIVASELPYWPLYTHSTFGTISSKYVFPGFSGWTPLYTSWALNVKLAS